MKKQRIGILGGTFDPIHHGHLVVAEASREKFQLDRVLFVPAGIPPHKKPDTVTDFWHRYLMVSLAVLANPCFEVSRLEYERGGITYTVDTMRQLRQIFGSSTALYFITGADTILEIFGWKKPEELLTLCNFIVATRPGYDLHLVEKVLGEYYQTAVFPLKMPQLGVSSSDIRRRVRDGRSIKYLVPEAVEAYICREGLYLDE